MQLTAIIESLLFASRDPITTKTLAKIVRRGAKLQLSGIAGELDDSGAEGAEGAEVGAGDEGAAEETGEGEEAGELAEEDDVDERIEFDQELMEALSHIKMDDVERAVAELSADYDEVGRPYVILERATGWKLYSRPEFGDWIRELFPGKRVPKLSPPALETLAIIAYRQPVTKASVEAVRGVAVDGVLHTLVERGLVHIAGRAELPGRPLLYETTPMFLEHFGIKEIDELPNSAELRRVPLPEPESEAEAAEGETQEELDLTGDDEDGVPVTAGGEEE